LPAKNQKKSKSKKDEYQKALEAYSKAMETFQKRDYQKAVQALEDFMETFQDEKDLIDRAKIYLALSRNRMEKEPVSLKTSEDYYQNGILKLNQGKLDEAIQSWEQALKKESNSGKTHYALADAYCISGEKKKCLNHLEKAIGQDPFFAVLAQNERDFEELGDDEEFRNLVNTNE
jgi:tetratricopeptide (TPR) repeat protein